MKTYTKIYNGKIHEERRVVLQSTGLFMEFLFNSESMCII